MVVVVSVSGTMVVVGLLGKVVLIIGSGAVETFVGQLEGKLVVIGRSAGVTVVVVVVGTGSGSTGVGVLAWILVK